MTPRIGRPPKLPRIATSYCLLFPTRSTSVSLCVTVEFGSIICWIRATTFSKEIPGRSWAPGLSDFDGTRLFRTRFRLAITPSTPGTIFTPINETLLDEPQLPHDTNRLAAAAVQGVE